MKPYKFLAILVILASFATKTNAQSEESAIKETLMNYLDGGTDGDTARFAKAFIPVAIQRSVAKDGKLSQMTVKELLGRITPGQKLSRSTKIVSWSYANNAATAITQTDYETSNLVDLLNLLKVNGQWKIVSRVFTRTEKGVEVASSAPMGNSSTAAMPSASSKSGTTAATTKKPAAKPKSDDGW